MKSIILSKTNKTKYIGLMKALNFCGIHTVFPDSLFSNQSYDFIFCDEMRTQLAQTLQQKGGVIISNTDFDPNVPHIKYDIRYALDTFSKGKEFDFMKCDVAYVGDWNSDASQILPSITGINQDFTTKVFGSPQMTEIEGYFWDFDTADIAANSLISLLLPTSKPEHKWDSIANEVPIIEIETLENDGSTQENLIREIEDILANYTHYKLLAEEARDEALNYETYFHEIRCILSMIDMKYSNPQIQPIIESVNFKYDENRLYCRQS
jgi:hypothetical protein